MDLVLKRFRRQQNIDLIMTLGALLAIKLSQAISYTDISKQVAGAL